MVVSSGFVPEVVFVIRHGDKYLTRCRHGGCPTWDYLSSKCVAWWKTKRYPKMLATKIRVLGIYPGGPKIDTVVEVVEFRKIGRPPKGTGL